MRGFEADIETSALWRFNESQQYICPSDVVESLYDLVPVMIMPAVVSGRFGRARQFDIDEAFTGEEMVAGALCLRRDMTIETIVKLEQSLDSGEHTILIRGKSGVLSAAEHRIFGLELYFTAGGEGVSNRNWLRMIWDRADNSAATVPGVTLRNSTDTRYRWWDLTQWIYLAVTRRWISATEVVVDYYLNGKLAGSATSAHGDIVDGEGGTLIVGARSDDTGTYEEYFTGPINQLRISNVVRSAEEIEQTYHALFVEPDRIHEVYKALLPIGDSYSQDPGSIIQKEIGVEAHGISVSSSIVRELDEYFLPDVAYRTLSRWESITRLAPKPGDSIATRRLRVVTFLRKIHGFSRAKILAELAPILDLDEEDLYLIEISNAWTDTFGDGTVALRWFVDATTGTITESFGKLNLAFLATAEARWNGLVRKPILARTSLQVDEDFEWVAELTSATMTTEGYRCGLCVYDHSTGDAIQFGLRRTGIGTYQWVKVELRSGVETLTALAGTPPAFPMYLRVLRSGVDPGTLSFQYSSTSLVAGPWTTLGTATGIAAQTWVGLFLASESASGATNADAKWSESRLWQPSLLDVYRWYVYRNSAEPGSPDLVGAQLVINKMRPSHTTGIVVESIAFAADDPNSLCDRDALGG
ncbi:MAG: LamG-like jellyroll fold domain-containing protein [Pseudomonadota bacterium]